MLHSGKAAGFHDKFADAPSRVAQAFAVKIDKCGIFACARLQRIALAKTRTPFRAVSEKINVVAHLDIIAAVDFARSEPSLLETM